MAKNKNSDINKNQLQKLRIGLLTKGSISEFRIKSLAPIINDPLFSINLVVVDSRQKLSTKAKLKKNLKRGRGGYIIIMAFKSLFKRPQKSINIDDFCSENKIEIHKTTTPYSEETINKIKSFDLDVLLLIGGFGIIKKSLLNITPIGVLSYHHGDMRKYRGMPPALWELYHGEKEVGATIQVLAPGLDKGVPIEEIKLEINPKDNLKKIQEKLYDKSVDMMYNALVKLAKPNFKPETIDKFGKVYTLPNFRQWVCLNLKVLWRKIRY